RANLVRFVKEARERKATPVLFTPVMRRKFTKEGAFVDQHGVYPGIVREVAAELKVPLIDMHRMSEQVLVKLGPDESRKLFLQLKPGENPNYPNGIEDNTHFNPLGAELMARLAVEGMRERKLGLAKYLLKKNRVKDWPQRHGGTELRISTLNLKFQIPNLRVSVSLWLTFLLQRRSIGRDPSLGARASLPA
ncbi:MAG TPA: hypothetical protein VKB12_07775, partial [Pyrinomonadaceae bacterium]|nr:hypothetical protein [Pyrinomonadaceae bacterium]